MSCRHGGNPPHGTHVFNPVRRIGVSPQTAQHSQATGEPLRQTLHMVCRSDAAATICSVFRFLRVEIFPVGVKGSFFLGAAL